MHEFKLQDNRRGLSLCIKISKEIYDTEENKRLELVGARQEVSKSLQIFLYKSKYYCKQRRESTIWEDKKNPPKNANEEKITILSGAKMQQVVQRFLHNRSRTLFQTTLSS